MAFSVCFTQNKMLFPFLIKLTANIQTYSLMMEMENEVDHVLSFLDVLIGINNKYVRSIFLQENLHRFTDKVS